MPSRKFHALWRGLNEKKVQEHLQNPRVVNTFARWQQHMRPSIKALSVPAFARRPVTQLQPKVRLLVGFMTLTECNQSQGYFILEVIRIDLQCHLEVTDAQQGHSGINRL